MKKCPECNSENIIRNARAFGGENFINPTELVVVVYENPKAMLLKRAARSEVKAEICGDCGYVQFYAKTPGILWAAYQNQEVNSIIEGEIKRRKDL